jgi:methylase of polypeptide subunit release factors
LYGGINLLRKPLLFARELVSASLKPGGVAVDATCGNGHDTVFLAEQVGPAGTVLAFDIQPQAINNTREKLRDCGLLAQVQLLETSHALLGNQLKTGVDAVMFNLGYLPGGDHTLTTQSLSTITALTCAIEKLNKDGIITLVIYTGHPGGREEYAAVRDVVAALPQQRFSVLEYQFINQINHPPLLLAVSRM